MAAVTLELTLVQKDGEHPKDIALGESREIQLEASRQIVIGREPSVDFVVRAPSVGRHVVRLTLEGGGVWVDDLGSGAGSSLQFKGLATHRPRHQLLPDQALLQVGRVGFRIHIAASE
jgi:pSer/pThr/pTyr-binding forkhead associated (FHA) protein